MPDELNPASSPIFLADTIAWCNERGSPLQPSQSLRSVERQPPFGLSWEATIDRAVELRHTRCTVHGVSQAHDLAGGRLLVYDPADNLCDGAALLASSGFFDGHNVPPWDTWIGYIYSGPGEYLTTRYRYNRLYLLSWVPPAFLILADNGVEANPEQCIRWAVDVEHEFFRQLQSVGLLA